MDILERIRRYLDNEGRYPWPLGCKANEISKESLIAWEMLIITEKLAISKYNPFIAVRRKHLLKLRLQGFSQPVLAELSGLSIQTIKRILPKKNTENE